MSSAVPSRHPAPEELDLLLEAAPADDRRRRLEAHVEGCPRCRGVVEEMAQVRTLLRAEGRRTPPPPPGLEDRLAHALAEVATDHPGSDTADVVPLRRRSPVPRWLAVAAGLVVLAGAATTATQLVGAGGGGSAALLSTDASDDSGVESGVESAQVPADGALPAPAGPADDGGTRLLVAGSPVVLATGTRYTTARLNDQVRELVALSLADDRPAGTTDDGPLATIEGQVSCLDAVGDPASLADAPSVVDLARWEGQDAAVLVVRTSAGEDVWVVERDCGSGAGGLLEHRVVTP